MRGAACLAAIVAVIAGVASARAAAPTLTVGKVVTLFKTQTGAKLAVDPRSSYRGHYTALVLPQSIANIGHYGHFTIWFVTSGEEQDVQDLLSDVHTGVLGTHDASGVYWERASNVYGQTSWLAKKRYGTQIVLWWYGSAHKTDATFARLQRVLLAVARS